VDTEKTRKILKESGNFFEIYHKTSFKGYRRNKQGETQEVEIDIFYGNGEYHCVATTKDGKTATGNPASSLLEMIPLVHWDDLDK